MITYDEWGNYMFHIQTGKEGMELFKQMGFKNPPKEEYEKHMDSHRKIMKQRNEELQIELDKFLEWCKTKQELNITN
jgi:hypothetical protein